jgi:hypothetical protein
MPARSRLHLLSAALLAAVAAAAAVPGCKKKEGDPNDPALGLRATPQAKRESRHRLQQIGLALHNSHDAMGYLPAGFAGPDGKTVGLSWRVAILPYIEHDNLYRQFKLNEPWDSDHNKRLIPQMPKEYAPPDTDTNGHTYLRSFSGRGGVMEVYAGWRGAPGQPVQGARLTAITDGTANTLMVVEAAEAVPWTKPDELELKPNGPPPKLGGVYRTGLHLLFCDGSVRWEDTIPPDTLRALITKDGGEVVNIGGHN